MGITIRVDDEIEILVDDTDGHFTQLVKRTRELQQLISADKSLTPLKTLSVNTKQLQQLIGGNK
jgi:hypothetical protein